MTKTHAPLTPVHPAPDTAPTPPTPEKHHAVPSPVTSPLPPTTEPHHDISTPAVEHANARMKLAAEPNGGEPLSHRDRGKAGRKG